MDPFPSSQIISTHLDHLLLHINGVGDSCSIRPGLGVLASLASTSQSKNLLNKDYDVTTPGNNWQLKIFVFPQQQLFRIYT